MLLRGRADRQRASIEVSNEFHNADLAHDEKAAVDRIVGTLLVRPSFVGDLHIWGFEGDLKDMHIRREGGVYVMYQQFTTVSPRRGQVTKFLFHIRVWLCGRYHQDGNHLWIDCLPDPIAL